MTAFENKVLMLGDMLELGEDSLKEHQDILRRALEISGELYLVGDEFRKAAESAGCAGVHTFDNIGELKAFVAENPLENATILIKGSNGKHMQEVVPEL